MFVLLFIVGLLSGIIGGMGMGGGTLLIPMLTLFFGINQHVAQAVNLVAFIPMSVFALIIHFKNKLVKTDGVLFIVLLGLIGSFTGSLLSVKISSDLLKRIFGFFLIALSIFQFTKTTKKQ